MNVLQIEKAKETEVRVVEPTELIREESETLKMNFFKAKPLTKNSTDDATEKPTTSSNDSDTMYKSEKLAFKMPDEPPITSKSMFSMPKAPSTSSISSSSRSISEGDLSSKSSSKLSSVFKVPEEKRDDKRKLSALDEIMSMEEKKREKQNRKDYWLHKVNDKKNVFYRLSRSAIYSLGILCKMTYFIRV